MDSLEIAAADAVVRVLLVKQDPVVKVDLVERDGLMVRVDNIGLDRSDRDVALGHRHFGPVRVGEDDLARRKRPQRAVERGFLAAVGAVHPRKVRVLREDHVLRAGV